MDKFKFRGGYCNLQAQDPENPLKKIIIRLDENKWKLKISKPERYYMIYNIDKIKDTLLSPDLICRSKHDVKTLIYYKKYDTIQIEDSIVPFKNCYFAVVWRKRWIRTVYPTDKIKAGEVLWRR